MTTERQLKVRTKRQLRKLRKAAEAWEAALDEFSAEMNEIESVALNEVEGDFDVWAWVADDSGMEYHSIYVGADCWTAWDEGEENPCHLRKLIEAVDLFFETNE